MGTRSTTNVIDGGFESTEIVCTMYRQFDGYPDGHGRQLYNFLSNLRIVNGLPFGETNLANGVGCLAAQIVANFKKEPGGIYLEVPSMSHDHDYGYNVFVDGLALKIEVYDLGQRSFQGTLEEYGTWLDSRH